MHGVFWDPSKYSATGSKMETLLIPHMYILFSLSPLCRYVGVWRAGKAVGENIFQFLSSYFLKNNCKLFFLTIWNLFRYKCTFISGSGQYVALHNCYQVLLTFVLETLKRQCHKFAEIFAFFLWLSAVQRTVQQTVHKVLCTFNIIVYTV